MSSWTNDSVPTVPAVLAPCRNVLAYFKRCCGLFYTREVDFNVETLGAVASMCGIYFRNRGSVLPLWEHCLFIWDSTLGLSLCFHVALVSEGISLISTGVGIHIFLQPLSFSLCPSSFPPTSPPALCSLLLLSFLLFLSTCQCTGRSCGKSVDLAWARSQQARYITMGIA